MGIRTETRTANAVCEDACCSQAKACCVRRTRAVPGRLGAVSCSTYAVSTRTPYCVDQDPCCVDQDGCCFDQNACCLDEDACCLERDASSVGQYASGLQEASRPDRMTMLGERKELFAAGGVCSQPVSIGSLMTRARPLIGGVRSLKPFVRHYFPRHVCDRSGRPFA